MRLNNNKLASSGLFITGTDTGVGKTYVTQQIVRQLTAQSISCVVMKPVASGAKQTADGLRNDDALELQQACDIKLPYELINPYCFEPAIAPHLAAQQAGVEIQVSVIMDAYAELSTLAEVVIVEGVGGWQVPLNANSNSPLMMSNLAFELQLPIVLVVALRLGCLNHALLTYHTIYNSGCNMAGWIANRPEPAFSSADDCVLTLQNLFAAPKLADLPFYSVAEELAESIESNRVSIDLDQLQLTN